MSRRVRHCSQCKSRDITVMKGEPDARLQMAVVANVYCNYCGHRERVVLGATKKRKGWVK